MTEPKGRRALAVVAVIGLGALAAASGRATSPARASTHWDAGTVSWALAGIAARRPTAPLLATSAPWQRWPCGNETGHGEPSAARPAPARTGSPHAAGGMGKPVHILW